MRGDDPVMRARFRGTRSGRTGPGQRARAWVLAPAAEAFARRGVGRGVLRRLVVQLREPREQGGYVPVPGAGGDGVRGLRHGPGQQDFSKNVVGHLRSQGEFVGKFVGKSPDLLKSYKLL